MPLISLSRSFRYCQNFVSSEFVRVPQFLVEPIKGMLEGHSETDFSEEGLASVKKAVRDRATDLSSRASDNQQQYQREDFEHVVQKGDQLVRNAQDGNLLFLDERMQRDAENADLEADTWGKALNALSALPQEVETRRNDVFKAEEAAFKEKLDKIRGKRTLLNKIRFADKTAQEARAKAEESSASAFLLLEKLRKHPLSFEMKAKVRREYAVKRAKSEALQKHADKAFKDSALLKRHLIREGLEKGISLSLTEELRLEKEISSKAAENPFFNFFEQGLKMSKLSLQDEIDERISRKAQAEKAVSRSQDQEGKRVSELNPINPLALILQPKNFLAQNKDLLASKRDVVFSGTTKETAPLLCADWVHRKCARACQKRHFFVSNAERDQWVEKRLNADSIPDMDVLQAITEREHILKSLRSTCASSKLQDLHLEADFMAPVLKLMGRLRISTVRVVEAIARWKGSRSAGTSFVSFQESENRKWVVKLGFIGEKIHSKQAFKLRIKRFNSDAEDTFAVRFRTICFCDTKLEAQRAYEKEILALCAKTMKSPKDFPTPKIVNYSCGKHFGIESDLGVENTRCEICYISSYNSLSFSPSYLWNGQNYLLKVLSDTNFLGEDALVSRFFASQIGDGRINFGGNPLLLASDVLDGSKRVMKLDSGESFDFGAPTDAAVVYQNGCVEWFGHLSSENVIRVGGHLAYVSQLVSSRSQVSSFVQKHRNSTVEILDMNRVRNAQRILAAEEDLARYVLVSKEAARTRAVQQKLDIEREIRRADQEKRRKRGEKIESDSEGEEEEGEMEIGVGEKEDILMPAEFARLSGRAVSEVPSHTRAEVLPKSRVHTAYFWDAGDYFAVQQLRHENVGKLSQTWAKADARTMFSGMRIRGRHSLRFEFERKLKENGKALSKRRRLIALRLAKSLKYGDRCNPQVIETLLSLGHETKGSVLLLECNRAEKFLERHRQRTAAAELIQSCVRSGLQRIEYQNLRQHHALRTAREFIRRKKAAQVSRSFLIESTALAKGRARLRLKKPLFRGCKRFQDGIRRIISIYDAGLSAQYQRTSLELQEACESCIGLQRNKRKSIDGSFLSLRGRVISVESCVEGKWLEKHGNVILEPCFEKYKSPCFCHRAEDRSQPKIVVEAFEPETSSRTLFAVELENSLAELRSLKNQNSFQSRFKQGVSAFCDSRKQRRVELAQERNNRAKALSHAQAEFTEAHKIFLASQLHMQAMTNRSDSALSFSKRQTEIYDNSSWRIRDQQSWDPLENAKDSIFIQRKRHAVGAVELARQMRNRAQGHVFEATLAFGEAQYRLELNEQEVPVIPELKEGAKHDISFDCNYYLNVQIASKSCRKKNFLAFPTGRLRRNLFVGAMRLSSSSCSKIAFVSVYIGLEQKLAVEVVEPITLKTSTWVISNSKAQILHINSSSHTSLQKRMKNAKKLANLVRLNQFSHQFEIGILDFWRRRDPLAQLLSVSAWLIDLKCRHSRTYGFCVFKQTECLVGGEEYDVELSERNRDFLFKFFSRKTLGLQRVIVTESQTREMLVLNGRQHYCLKWRQSCKLGIYDDSFVKDLVSRFRFQSPRKSGELGPVFTGVPPSSTLGGKVVQLGKPFVSPEEGLMMEETLKFVMDDRFVEPLVFKARSLVSECIVILSIRMSSKMVRFEAYFPTSKVTLQLVESRVALEKFALNLAKPSTILPFLKIEKFRKDSISVQDHRFTGKYAKMLRIGVSRTQVLNEILRKEGEDGEKIAAIVFGMDPTEKIESYSGYKDALVLSQSPKHENFRMVCNCKVGILLLW